MFPFLSFFAPAAKIEHARWHAAEASIPNICAIT
jgi:hypothetical protein